MTFRTSILSSILVVLGATAAFGQGRPTTRRRVTSRTPRACPQQLNSSERPRAYRLFVPPGYDGRRRLPLVLDMHGSGGNAAGQARTSGLETLSASERFLVATLEGEGNRWNVPVQDGRANDVNYVSDVIDARGRAGVHRRDADLRHRILGRRTDDVAARRAARLAPCGRRAGVRVAMAGPVRRPCGAGADVPRPRRSAEPVRRSCRRPRRRVGRERARCARGLGAPQQVQGRRILEDPAGPLSTMRYDGCGDAEVRMIRIDGLGHTWTRVEVDTTAVMWEFFKSHRLSL